MVQISSDTLRYYDEIQLLNPDYINPSNNYRFYNEEQVKELLYIMELKDCGFNLEEIKKILKLSDEAKIEKLFTKKQAELVVQSGKINSAIQRIENKLKVMNVMEEKVMKQKILIVDDAAFMRMMLKDILGKNGFDDIIEAENGLEGVEKFKEHKPALTIMDIAMPAMDGIEAVRQIKEIDGSAKIVMLSAAVNGDPKYIAKSLISGAVDFILKPFQADRLAEVVKKHLSNDIELDTDEVKLWLTDCNEDFLSEKSEQIQPFKITDDKLLGEKLLEAIISCTDVPPSYHDSVIKALIQAIQNYTTMIASAKKVAMTQSELDELLARATK